MQGKRTRKVADLSEFWSGQKNIVLYDPNITAAKECIDLFHDLASSGAYVNFSQGLDLRLLTDEKIEALKGIKIKTIHFAWDRFEDRDVIMPNLQNLITKTGWKTWRILVYMIVGDKERHVTEEDITRAMELRKLGVLPYTMIYDKESLPRGSDLVKFSRWTNNPYVWARTERFEDYKR